MGDGGHDAATYWALLLFVALMGWRFLRIDKARPLRLPLLWVAPILVSLAVGIALLGLPPSPLGWAAFAAGLAIGGGFGIQRSRLMRLHIEGEGRKARVMMRHSPMALLVVLLLFGAKRMLLPDMEIQGPHPAASALLVMDGTLGLMLGMVLLSRVVLWKRARAMVAAHVFDS